MKDERIALKGENRLDYFWILCAKCNVPTDNEYLGREGAYPHFKSSCPQCGETHEYKLEPRRWKGLP